MIERRSIARAAGATTTLVLVAALLAPGAGASPARARLRGSRARFARPQNLVRRASGSSHLDFEVYLGLADMAGAEATVRRVSDPASAGYGRYLAPAAFRARYARSQADVDAVSTWLRSRGIVVTYVPANHTVVGATGSVAQVNRAFDVSLGYYRTGGRVLRAPDRAPSVPSSLAGVVRGVLGLTPLKMQHAKVPPPPAAYRVGRPCSSFWAQQMATGAPKMLGKTQSLAVCGYTPEQMQGAYGVADAIGGGLDGSGVTVAIVDAFNAPTIQADLDTYSSRHGLPQTTIDNRSAPTAPNSRPGLQQGWWGEQTLDVEAVHSMAPGADILYWGGASAKNYHLRNALADILDHHSADIITNSYGSVKGEQQSQSEIDAWHDLMIQGGAEGIGMYFSSGDDGDEIAAVGYRTVSTPASDPLAIAVGGTSLGVGAFNQYLFETGWGTTTAYETKHHTWGGRSFVYGGGGGTSRVFAEPWYQHGVVPAKMAGVYGGAARVVPDIAMDGDPTTGFLVGETQTFLNGTEKYGEYRIGGTSLSSPLLAGVMALADQAAGTAHGFANPAFYALEGTSAVRDIVNPSTTVATVRVNFLNNENGSAGKYYSLRLLNQTGTLHTKVGYDNVTGVGTPNGEAFLNALS